jgi:hypothetical protein
MLGGGWRHPVDQLVAFVLLHDHRHEISPFVVQTVAPNQGDFKSSLAPLHELMVGGRKFPGYASPVSSCDERME